MPLNEIVFSEIRVFMGMGNRKDPHPPIAFVTSMSPAKSSRKSMVGETIGCKSRKLAQQKHALTKACKGIGAPIMPSVRRMTSAREHAFGISCGAPGPAR